MLYFFVTQSQICVALIPFKSKCLVLSFITIVEYVQLLLLLLLLLLLYRKHSFILTFVLAYVMNKENTPVRKVPSHPS